MHITLQPKKILLLNQEKTKEALIPDQKYSIMEKTRTW